jgi:cytochrome c
LVGLALVLFLRIKPIMPSKNSLWSISVKGILMVCLSGVGVGSFYPTNEARSNTLNVMPAIPSLDSIPSTPAGEQIRLGYNLIVHTRTFAKRFVGNSLSCSNCHLEAGQKMGAGTYVGVIYAYPQYKARAGREISLEDRINECFERSLNGTSLPSGSPEMTALLAYMSWLSQNFSSSVKLTWLGFPSLPLTQRPDNHLEGSSPGRYSWEIGQESLSLSNPRRSHEQIVRRD